MSVLIDSPASSQDSEKEAWQYFRNAFSVHTELLYQKTDIVAVLVCHSPHPSDPNWVDIYTLGLNSHGTILES
jgi:hypothetical protein